MNRIQTIFSEQWAMSEYRYANLMSLVLPAVKAGKFQELEEFLAKDAMEMFALDFNFADNWRLDDKNLPSDSIAVIPLCGELYSWRIDELSGLLDEALANDRIAGIVLTVNGPGGMVLGLDAVSTKIATAQKPIASLITGAAESAHYWIASATRRRFLASKMCQLGCIGIVGVYTNYQSYFEKQGIDYRTIYPEGADLKNYETRQIEEKDNEGPYRERLQKIHEYFCGVVAKNLKIPYDKESPIFRGATLMGDDAIAAGLADAYGDLTSAARWVLAQAVKKRTNLIF